MRHMLRAAAFAFAAAAVFAVSATDAQATPDVAVGDILTMKHSVPPPVTGAGEFQVEILSPVPSGPDKFRTFCIQKNEPLVIGQNYAVLSITDYAFEEEDAGDGGTDPLDPRTAYLYTAFRTGTLVGYTGNVASQDALQSAIWVIENETGAALISPLAIQFYNAANAAGWTDIGNVRIANLLHADGPKIGELAQDILVLVPEPASILGWSLIGGCFLVGHRLRRNRLVA